jgi:hypothetical protein
MQVFLMLRPGANLDSKKAVIADYLAKNYYGKWEAQNLTFTPRELFGVGPQANEGVPAVPQIMAKNAEHFLWAACALRDMGYNEVNLNLGCPSGTVTAKGKGAGMLSDVVALDSFLEKIFDKAPTEKKEDDTEEIVTDEEIFDEIV